MSDVGFAPSVNVSADKYRLGHITKQGSALLRSRSTRRGSPDLAGLAASLSDRSLEEELGLRRRFTPLEVDTARQRTGLAPLA